MPSFFWTEFTKYIITEIMQPFVIHQSNGTKIFEYLNTFREPEKIPFLSSLYGMCVFVPYGDKKIKGNSSQNAAQLFVERCF